MLAMAKSKEDQTKPLAPLSLTTPSDQPHEDQYHDLTKHFHHHHSRTKLILCCGLVASLTLLIAVTFIVLSLTVFHFRNPNLAVQSISFIQPLDLVNGKVNRNATVLVEISLHNPNAARFRVKKAMVSSPYSERLKSIVRRETIPAKRTVKMNLTAEIVTTRLLAYVPSLMEDLNGRGVDLRTSVEVIGNVKMIKIFKKSVHLKTDCSMKITKNSLNPTYNCFRT